jgi:hypothetical protein
MSCRDCGKPIDRHMAEQASRLAARFSPGQPIKMPVRCSACLWNAIPKILAEDPPDGDAPESPPTDEGERR